MSIAHSRRVSCGVVISDGRKLLLGHASRSPRWDIPKGVAEPGEDMTTAALRELKEETGLVAESAALDFLGAHLYLTGKDLALFAWRLAELPAPESLRCTSMIGRPGYRMVPELDRFGVFAFDPALTMVGKNLARVLNSLRDRIIA